MSDLDPSNFIELTADIVAAYVERNSLSRTDLPDVIAAIHGALSSLGAGPARPAAKPQQPAVNPKKSVTDDYIISLEDGRKFKSLKSHLTALGISPEDYRTKWRLPSDYPMVAPAYAKVRSKIARNIGFRPKKAPGSEIAAASAPAKKRGRPKRAA